MIQVDTQLFTSFELPNALKLESGQELGPITIAYETYGTLNDDKSNAILICHALSGDAHAAGKHNDNPDYRGWWDLYVGPGKPLDTDKFFVICSNVIGGCKGSTGPNSIDPKTQNPYGLNFPVITIGDMVNAQKVLIDHLGITKLCAVIGGSMGGMQVIEWGIMYPDMLKSAIVIASTSKSSPQSMAFDAVGRNAIISDSNWQDGDYYNDENQPDKGLSIARMIGHITYLSDESMNLKFGRRLQAKNDYGYDFATDFQVESYLKYQGDKFVTRFDANSFLYLTKAISYFDVEKKYGSLEDAFKNVSADFLVIAISSDWLYPPKQSKVMVKTLMKLNKDVTFFQCDSPYGHDTFLIENEQMASILERFLAKAG